MHMCVAHCIQTTKFPLQFLLPLLSGECSLQLYIVIQETLCTLEFQKAVDTVSHQKLLSKLSSHGVRGEFLLLISNWLKNRNSVEING